MGSPLRLDFSDLLCEIAFGYKLDLDGIHGLNHWARVFHFGSLIAKDLEHVDLIVVELFALFHDSRRENENSDPEHGYRGSQLAIQLLSDYIDSYRLHTLVEACIWHTSQTFSKNLTVQVCWDADRLDLFRLGIEVNPAFLNTSNAKSLVKDIPGIWPSEVHVRNIKNRWRKK
ncbi:MAG TPA: hypothetical protein PKA63_03005 [Oligoflexia bacterium]|nr:hypothetical protein [Oligoflexia bacterium]HMP47623.1 hypothetical protein [Oligoflexia bacterium]